MELLVETILMEKQVRQLMRLFPLCFFLVAFTGCVHTKSESDEIFEWMDNTYNPHNAYSPDGPRGRADWYQRGENGGPDVLYSGTVETFERDGCKMILYLEDEGLRAEEIKDVVVIKFSLKDIDPSSLRVQGYSHYGGLPCEGTEDPLITDCDHAELTFRTHNEAPLISEDRRIIYQKLTGKQHEVRHFDRQSNGYFEIGDLAYAKRFAKAFARAIELCGGRPSPF